jgi:hypothetical protein
MNKQTQITVKWTKKRFEEHLSLMYNGFEYSPYPTIDYQNLDAYGNPKIVHLTLYYKNDVHIGTWQKGGGWYTAKAEDK